MIEEADRDGDGEIGEDDFIRIISWRFYMELRKSQISIEPID